MLFYLEVIVKHSGNLWSYANAVLCLPLLGEDIDILHLRDLISERKRVLAVFYF